MHNFRGLCGLILLTVFSVTSCKKDVRSLDMNLTAVDNLTAPDDQTAIQLDPASQDSVSFKWDNTMAKDGDLVLYEIAFDKENGDFSQPLYKAVSDGAGVQPHVTLTHKDLNKIASLGGIQASGTGKLKWAVFASKGTNEVLSSKTRTIQLDRPAGFAVVPETLYLKGTATEAGSDLTKAIPLKRNEDGIFELYTSLKPGSYLLSDRAAAGGTEYYIENGLIKQGSTAVKVNSAVQPYHLLLDFNVATAKVSAISSIGLYISGYGKEMGQLTYIGNSTWEAASIPIEFYQFDWGKDDRYKFVVHTAAGLEYLGSQNVNNVSPAGQPASYFYLFPVSNDQWNNTFKFDPSADKHNIKADLIFKADAFSHVITIN